MVHGSGGEFYEMIFFASAKRILGYIFNPYRPLMISREVKNADRNDQYFSCKKTTIIYSL